MNIDGWPNALEMTDTVAGYLDSSLIAPDGDADLQVHMTNVVRGVVRCHSGDEEELMLDNLAMVLDSDLVMSDCDAAIVQFSREYLDGVGPMPDVANARAHFEAASKPEAVARLNDAAEVDYQRTGTAFRFSLEQAESERNRLDFNALLQEAAAINRTGRMEGTVLKKGPIDAVSFLSDHISRFLHAKGRVGDMAHLLVSKLVMIPHSLPVSGDVRKDGGDFAMRFLVKGLKRLAGRPV